MTSRFVRFWARILVLVGLALACGGVVLAAVALVIDMPWGSVTGQAVAERTFVAAFLVISGVLAGAPFILLGEMVVVFLDQRRLLARIARRLRRWEATESRHGERQVQRAPRP
jgi:hypothetical protein